MMTSPITLWIAAGLALALAGRVAFFQPRSLETGAFVLGLVALILLIQRLPEIHVFNGLARCRFPPFAFPPLEPGGNAVFYIHRIRGEIDATGAGQGF